MRTASLALAAVLASAPGLTRAQQAKAPASARGADDLGRARALDQQGAKAYSEGRYNDAIRYFEEALRLGGPAFEQWNIARCHLRLDQPEQAANMLDKYLATPTLPPDEREEAQQQLEQLKRRPSTLTVSSSPSGASVAVDGRPVEGKTPLSVTVAPGHHAVSVTSPEYAIYNKQVEAKYGRAIILDAPLSRGGEEPPGGYGARPRWAVRAWLGIDLPRHGSVTGSAEPGAMIAGAYRVANVGPAGLSAGVAALLTGDSWANTVNAPTSIRGCASSLAGGQSATALSLFGVVTGGWEVLPRLRVHAVGGAGAALYFTGSDVGGDLFAPSCRAQTGSRPALLAAAQVDYDVTPTIRLSALPIAVQLHQGFDGARTEPIDASGLWIRAVIALGAGVDF